MRPYWKGYLKLALVSCPIALHAACSTAERIAFRQINKATGNRLRQQLIDEETREPVAPEHKGRGYEIAKGKYLIVEEAELEAMEIESTHTIEIDSFVPRSEIDQRFFDTPYYITPNEPVGQEAFAVIREAMRGKGMVALGRLVLSKRERVIALEPYDKGLLGTTLRYRYEVRKAEDYFCDLPDLTIAPDMLTLAEHILDSKASEFDPASFRDRYEEALLAHLKAKQAGAVPERRKTFAPAAPGGQSHAGIAPQRRRGHQRCRSAQGSLGNPGAQTGVSAIANRAAMLPLADSRDGTVDLVLDPLRVVAFNTCIVRNFWLDIGVTQRGAEKPLVVWLKPPLVSSATLRRNASMRLTTRWLTVFA